MHHKSIHKIIIISSITILIFYKGFASSIINYKILSHRAFINLLPSEQKIEIIDTLQVEFSGRILELLLNPIYSVDKILYNGKSLDFNKEKEKLIISGDFKQIQNLIIKYNGIFNYKTEFSEFTNNFAILRDNDILPIGTKTFEYIRFSIKLPQDWEAITIGEKISELKSDDFKISVFENKEKIETIGWICAGKFFTKHKIFDELEISVNMIEDRPDLADSIINLTKQTLDFYSGKFSKYRFPKLSIVEVDDWLAGNVVLAAAYPSVILFKNRTFETSDKQNHIFTILPHEVAHQWWPITNFVQEEDIAFLSEGLCEYSAILFNEHSLKNPTRLNQHPLLRSLIIKSEKDLDIPLNQKIDLRSMPTHYLKASYVHNMLRYEIGEQNYLELLKKYAKEFAIKKSSTKDFFDLAETISQKKLNYFYEQWITKKGIPKFKIYGVKIELKSNNKWQTKGRIRQIGYKSHFSTQIEVEIQSNKDTLKQIIYIGYDQSNKFRNEVEFVFETDFKPEKVLIDPEGHILKWQKLPARLSDLRDPSQGYMIIGTNCLKDRYLQLINLAINDSIEMSKAGWYLKIIDDTSATLQQLQSDNVFIYGNNHENKIANDQLNKFQIIPKNNFIEIDDVIYSDSLSLLQVIENPYNDKGLFCWIIPFTEKSNPVLLPYDASYVIVDRSNIIAKGDWKIKNDDLIFEFK